MFKNTGARSVEEKLFFFFLFWRLFYFVNKRNSFSLQEKRISQLCVYSRGLCRCRSSCARCSFHKGRLFSVRCSCLIYSLLLKASVSLHISLTARQQRRLIPRHLAVCHKQKLCQLPFNCGKCSLCQLPNASVSSDAATI